MPFLNDEPVHDMWDKIISSLDGLSCFVSAVDYHKCAADFILTKWNLISILIIKISVICILKNIVHEIDTYVLKNMCRRQTNAIQNPNLIRVKYMYVARLLA